MTLKKLSLILTVVVLCGWLSARVAVRLIAGPSVQLTDRWVSMVETLNKNGAPALTVQETITVNAEGKIRTDRNAISGASDGGWSEIVDIERSIGAQWFNAIPVVSTATRGPFSRAELEQRWVAEKCNTLAAANIPGPNQTIQSLGEVTLPTKVKAYGIRIQTRAAEDDNLLEEPNPWVYQTTTVYRAPDFGCNDVKMHGEVVFKDGSIQIFTDKSIIASGIGTRGVSFDPPPKFREASRVEAIKAYKVRMGVQKPTTPEEQSDFDQMEEAYQRGKVAR